jgi:ABC-type Na+ efflux pump permease subunit
MKSWVVFAKGIREQAREFWILLTILVMAPLFIAIYFLMEETGEEGYTIVIVNQDLGTVWSGQEVRLGDSIVQLGTAEPQESQVRLICIIQQERAGAINRLQEGSADAALVIPPGFSEGVLGKTTEQRGFSELELIGDVTRMGYLIAAVWTEELVTSYVHEVAGITPLVSWTETTLGYSGERSGFELYVPGLLILSIIMIIFSAAAAIVRESEAGTLERLKLSGLTSLQFLAGTSLVQIIIAALSLCLLYTSPSPRDRQKSRMPSSA